MSDDEKKRYGPPSQSNTKILENYEIVSSQEIKIEERNEILK